MGGRGCAHFVAPFSGTLDEFPPPHFRIDPGNVVHCNVLLVCVDAFEDLGVSGTVKTEWILANWYQKN